MFAGYRLIFVLTSASSFTGSHTGVSCAAESPRFMAFMISEVMVRFRLISNMGRVLLTSATCASERIVLSPFHPVAEGRYPRVAAQV